MSLSTIPTHPNPGLETDRVGRGLGKDHGVDNSATYCSVATVCRTGSPSRVPTSVGVGPTVTNVWSDGTDWGRADGVTGVGV